MLIDTSDTLVDQKGLLDRLKSSYILVINEFTHNIPTIAGLPAVQKVRALRELHDEFGPTAIRFLFDLTHSTASVVRAETSLPAVKAQTTAKLASDLLTEAYHGAMEYLSKLHIQTPATAPLKQRKVYQIFPGVVAPPLEKEGVLPRPGDEGE